nr:hypothetical protein GCM10017611_23460 [Rhodococcus wratislaviensis]
MRAVRRALVIECEAEGDRGTAAIDDVSERQQLRVGAIVSGGGGALMRAGRNGSTSSTAGTGTGSALSTISNGSRITRNVARRLLDDSEVGMGRRMTPPGRFISVS